MGYPIIAYLVFVVVTLPWVEGQFPRVCTDRDSLRDKKCCPTPKGFTIHCGSDGDRGQCHELTTHDWTSKYSHYRPFQMVFTTKSANATQTMQVTIAANARLATMAVPARRRKI